MIGFLDSPNTKIGVQEYWNISFEEDKINRISEEKIKKHKKYSLAKGSFSIEDQTNVKENKPANRFTEIFRSWPILSIDISRCSLKEFEEDNRTAKQIHCCLDEDRITVEDQEDLIENTASNRFTELFRSRPILSIDIISRCNGPKT